MGKHSKGRFAFAPLKILGIEEKSEGGLRMTVEAVRPGPVNQFNVTEKFIDATLERWVGRHVVVTHDTQARIDTVVGEIASARKDETTKALIFDIDINASNPAVVENIRKGRAAVSIGATDPVLTTDPETSPAPWDVIDGSPDHLMITRKGHQAQPNAQVLEIHASMGDALAALYGVNLKGQKTNRFGDFILASILSMVREDRTRESIESQLIEVAKIDTERLASLMEGQALPTLEEIRAFARILWTDIESLLVVAEASGADFSGDIKEDDEEMKSMVEAAKKTAANLPTESAALKAALITLQGNQPRETNMTEKLEAEMKAIEAKNADLTQQVADITKERDTLSGRLVEIEVAGFQEKIRAIEATMGKPENELSDLTGKTVAEASVAYTATLEARIANPPAAPKPKVPVRAAPIEGTNVNDRKMKPLFAMRDLSGSDSDSEESA